MPGQQTLAVHAPATIETSEQRAAELVVDRFGDEIRFDASRGRFLVHVGGRWVEDPGDAPAVGERVMTIARESRARLIRAKLKEKDAERIARELQSAAGLRAVKSLLRSTPSLVVTGDQFDRDPFALNCLNGTVDLRTGELRSHSAADLITKQCPVDYDPDAECETWSEHLNLVFAEDQELIDYVQQCCGLYASGDISVEELHVWCGTGSNGKSKTYEAIMHALGDYADVAPEGLIVERGRGAEHPTEIADVMGKRLVIASETEDGGKLRMAFVKRLTGDAVLKARFMRQDYFKFRRTHKTILCTNHRPVVEESTEAVWRRLRMIPFNVTIPERLRDKDMSEKLKREAAGILAWMVRGSIDRLTNPVDPPACVLAATQEYRESSDHFSTFKDESLVVEFGEKINITRQELIDAYTKWAAEAGEPETLKPARVYEAIRQIPGVRKHEWGEKDANGKWQKRRGFSGIRLKDGFERAEQEQDLYGHR